MDKVGNLKERAEEIYQLVERDVHFLKECDFLNTTQDPYDLYFINRNPALQMLRFSLLFIMVVDINILFKKEKENYSIVQLLRKTLDAYEEIPDPDWISKEQINKWLNEIETGKIAPIVQKIRTVRNKHYAHLDINRPELNTIMPTISEFGRVLDLAKEIMRAYHNALSKSDRIFDPVMKMTSSEELLSLLKDRDMIYKRLEDDLMK